MIALFRAITFPCKLNLFEVYFKIYISGQFNTDIIPCKRVKTIFAKKKMIFKLVSPEPIISIVIIKVSVCVVLNSKLRMGNKLHS